MNVASNVKTDATTPDTARVSDRAVRVHAAMRCPHCLRGRLRASGVHEISEHQFAWRCGHCHRDVLTITVD
jgi:Zn finger protein HypA/HybF involved in hydrogenase expression